MKLVLTKMCGAGNDFLIADENSGFTENLISKIPELCHRRFGLGSDGFCLLSSSSKNADLKWEFFNQDGSRASMCGNAACCITEYALKKKLTQKNPFTFEIQNKVLTGEVKNNQAWVQTPLPRLLQTTSLENSEKTPIHHIDSGVLHLLIDESHLSENLKTLAQNLRKKHPDANITFFKKTGSQTLSARTFERGVEDFTLACGTGALAASFLMKEKDLTYKVQMPGGTLTVTFEHNLSWLQSPVQWIGEISPFL